GRAGGGASASSVADALSVGVADSAAGMRSAGRGIGTGACWAKAGAPVASAAMQARTRIQARKPTPVPLGALTTQLTPTTPFGPYSWIGENLCHKDVVAARTQA